MENEAVTAQPGRPMMIAQISDLHIVEPGRRTCSVAPTAENLRLCIDSINGLDPRPDLVLISGDLTHDGRPAQAEHAARLLARLVCPWVLVPGNHDDRRHLQGALGAGIGGILPGGFICFVVEDHPVRIIALDSVAAGRPGGALCETRLAWLEARLSEQPDRPTILVMHHPPLRLGVPETDLDGFRGAAQLAELVAAYPNIERILCGHVHMPLHVRWQGSVVTTAPSTAMDIRLDPKQRGESQFMLSQPAYLLHRRSAEGVLVTHLLRLGDDAGPFRFTAGDADAP